MEKVYVTSIDPYILKKSLELVVSSINSTLIIFYVNYLKLSPSENYKDLYVN